ncbi:MAG: DUF4855 domain-containing protein [Firmicutes bacterium]|nr:DUF4855 domain-containing protein [Bacillota bacterium]
MTEQGYFPPLTEDSKGIRDLMLIYTNYGVNWNLKDALSYVAYIDKNENQNRIKDWFFDSYLFLALMSNNKRAFDSPARATPAIKEDWQWWLDDLFRPGAQLSVFNEAYRVANEALPEKRKGKIYIMIPNPIAKITEFGEVNGENLDFSSQNPTEATRQRFKAVEWFVEAFMELYEKANFDHLDLAGFYWLEETIHENPGEDDLVRKVADYVHDMNLKFCWIPWFRAEGHHRWQEVGFDFCIHQPNYMFNDKVPLSRFEDVTSDAKKYYQGIEIEAFHKVMESKESRERFYDYLRAGVTYGYMKDAIHGYYQDSHIFAQSAYSDDPEIREIYDNVYKFVQGTWTESL